MVRLAAERLGSLRKEVVFVGGAVVGLLLTDPAAREPRPTLDVDVIVEVGSTLDYYRLEDSLRGLGFMNATEGPICRFRHGKLILDVMPTSEDVLGFGNPWYASASAKAQPCDLGQGMDVRLISAVHFIATKFVAFESATREDHGDYLLSRDFEDIVAVLDGREDIVSEVSASDPELRNFVRERARFHLAAFGFDEGVAAHLEVDAASQARVGIVLRRLREIVG